MNIEAVGMLCLFVMILSFCCGWACCSITSLCQAPECYDDDDDDDDDDETLYPDHDPDDDWEDEDDDFSDEDDDDLDDESDYADDDEITEEIDTSLL